MNSAEQIFEGELGEDSVKYRFAREADLWSLNGWRFVSGEWRLFSGCLNSSLSRCVHDFQKSLEARYGGIDDKTHTFLLGLSSFDANETGLS